MGKENNIKSSTVGFLTKQLHEAFNKSNKQKATPGNQARPRTVTVTIKLSSGLVLWGFFSEWYNYWESEWYNKINGELNGTINGEVTGTLYG